MYKFNVLVQNKRATNNTYHFRKGYIKARNKQEAEKNINTVFSSFNFAIAELKPVMLP